MSRRLGRNNGHMWTQLFVSMVQATVSAILSIVSCVLLFPQLTIEDPSVERQLLLPAYVTPTPMRQEMLFTFLKGAVVASIKAIASLLAIVSLSVGQVLGFDQQHVDFQQHADYIEARITRVSLLTIYCAVRFSASVVELMNDPEIQEWLMPLAFMDNTPEDANDVTMAP